MLYKCKMFLSFNKLNHVFTIWDPSHTRSPMKQPSVWAKIFFCITAAVEFFFLVCFTSYH